MALLQVGFFAETLGKQVHMNVLLPQRSGSRALPGEIPSYPTLYLLHGMSDDYTIWERRTSIERYAADKNLAVVMPDGDLSWYTDMKFGGRYFTFLSEELPAVCRDLFPQLSQKREDTFVAGLSMGGYGAFKLAMRCPEAFSCAASLSGALDFGTFYDCMPPEFAYRIAGDRESEFTGGENDLFAVARRLGESGRPRPRLWQWCGLEDSLLHDNHRMRDHLLALGYDLTYSESDGSHSWAYWDREIQRVLNWLLPEKP